MNVTDAVDCAAFPSLSFPCAFSCHSLPINQSQELAAHTTLSRRGKCLLDLTEAVIFVIRLECHMRMVAERSLGDFTQEVAFWSGDLDDDLDTDDDLDLDLYGPV